MTLFERELTLNHFLRQHLDRLTADLQDSELDQQAGVGHSARWILVHLAIAVDYGLMQFGAAGVCPKSWHAAYGPGSSAGSHDSIRPSLAELKQAMNDGWQKLESCCRAADPALTEVPHDLDLLKNTPLRTKGDLAAHILTTHMATHIGQLSLWRRLFGKPHLF